MPFDNHGSTTIDHYNDVAGNQYNKFITTGDAKTFLRLSAATAAAWNSSARSPADVCCDGTRVKALSDITQWLEDFRTRGKIYWLSGASGLGKSAIAQSLAKQCFDRQVLGASFFFSEDDEGRNSARKLLTTIAYQLCWVSKQQDKRVRSALEKDRGVIDRRPSDQLQTLLVKTIPSGFAKNVVIIDALDQGGSDELLEEVLPVILEAAQSTPLRFVVTSQMTSSIQSFIQAHSQYIKLTDLSSYDVDLDIRCFYITHFDKLSTSRQINGWYDGHDIKQLVAATGGLFVYAAAVAKYIENGRRRSPRQRLEDVLRIDAKQFPEIRERLDALYRRILSQIPQRDYDDLTRKVIGTICLVSYPLSLPDLDTLLGFDSGDTWQCLQDLHAFIQVPNNDDKESCVRLSHRFFRDFICDPERSKQYTFDTTAHHFYLGSRCLDTLVSGLRENMCNLAPSGTLMEPSTDVQVKCSEFISGAVEYASRFWCHHLRNGQASNASLACLLSLGQRTLLHWLEAMSLLHRLDEAVKILHEVEPLVEALGDFSLGQRLDEVTRLTEVNFEKITNWPLNVYRLDIHDVKAHIPLSDLAPIPEQPPEQQPLTRGVAQGRSPSSSEPVCPDYLPSVEAPPAALPHHQIPVKLTPPHPNEATDEAQMSPNSLSLALSSKSSPPPLPPRQVRTVSEDYSQPTVWCIDRSPSRNYTFAAHWTEPGLSTANHLDLYLPEIPGASYEEKYPRDKWTQGWSCSNCSKLAGDLVMYSVSNENPSITCEACLLHDVALRSQTFVLFHWLNRHQVGQRQYTPRLTRIRSNCDDCNNPIPDGGDWMHCVGCRHIKSRDICTPCYCRLIQEAATPCVFIRCVAPMMLPTSAASSTSPRCATSWSRRGAVAALSPLELASPSNSSSYPMTPPDLLWQAFDELGTPPFPPFSPPASNPLSALPAWASPQSNPYISPSYVSTSNPNYPIPGKPVGATISVIPRPGNMKFTTGPMPMSMPTSKPPPQHPSRARFEELSRLIL